LIFGGRREIRLADRNAAGEIAIRFDKVLNLRRESTCAGTAGWLAWAKNKFINQ
jgi:hypothetical protein